MRFDAYPKLIMQIKGQKRKNIQATPKAAHRRSASDAHVQGVRKTGEFFCRKVVGERLAAVSGLKAGAREQGRNDLFERAEGFGLVSGRLGV